MGSRVVVPFIQESCGSPSASLSRITFMSVTSSAPETMMFCFSFGMKPNAKERQESKMVAT